ncbi:hypothetical protein CF319_g5502 [Tilletia indica]|nr:hypothetical protein CF319_g5502 [Tilletia indica]
MIGDDGADTERNMASTASGNAREAWLQSFRKPIPLPPTSRCIGLAVVRSISRDRQELHLLGPIQAALAYQRGSSRVRSLALVPHLLQASSARLEGRGDEGGQSDDEEEPD